MCISKQQLIFAFILCLSIVSMFSENSAASEPSTTNKLKLNLGETLSVEDLAPFDITIFPDGQNLPSGQGTAKLGAEIYQVQCSICHGENGIEGPAARLAGSSGWFSFSDPLRILRIKKHPILLISVGDLWPYATSIFDYIRRAMPHYAPKSLSNDQIYALTAYILYLNNIIEEEKVINQQNLPKINMPGKRRSISIQP